MLTFNKMTEVWGLTDFNQAEHCHRSKSVQ